MRFALLLLLLWPSLTMPLEAKDIFVNNTTGSDLYDGSAEVSTAEPFGPVKTITKALRIASAADRIHIANTGEPYRESITLQGGRHSGTQDLPFAIFGNGATIDGSKRVPAVAWEHYGGSVFRFRPLRVQYQQLFSAGKPLVRQLGDPTDKTIMPELGPLEWATHGAYVYFRCEEGKSPQDYEISCAGEAAGITMYQVRHASVFDLVLQGFAGDGINVHDALGPSRIAGLTCRSNGRSGIAVVGASRVQVEGCLAYANAEAQLLVDGLTETYVINCDLDEATVPAYVRKRGKLYIDGQKVE